MSILPETTTKTQQQGVNMNNTDFELDINEDEFIVHEINNITYREMGNIKPYTVYEVVNLDPQSDGFGFKYRGRHRIEQDEHLLAYVGAYCSRMGKWNRESRRRHGRHDVNYYYHKKILASFNTEAEAMIYEKKMLDSKWMSDPNTCNVESTSNGGPSNKNHPLWGKEVPDNVKEKISNATRGFKHWKAIKILTPLGIFGSAREAGRAHGAEDEPLSHVEVLRRCRSSNEKWSDWSVI